MKNISIRTGLLSLLALMTTLLLIVSVMGMVAINKSYQALLAVNDTQGVQLGNLASSNTNMQRIRVVASLAVRNIELNKLEDGAAAAQRAASYADIADQELQRFFAAVEGQDQAAALGLEIKKAYQDYREKGLNPMINALKQRDLKTYYAMIDTQLRPLGIAFDKANKNFFEYAQGVGQLQLDNAATDKTMMMVMIACCVVLTLALMLLAWMVMRLMLINPLHQAVRLLEYISAGDLTQPIPAASRNELGRLNAGLGVMQQSLVASVSRVRDASVQIETGSAELANGNDDLSRRTEMSASSLEETAASMEQLTATVKHNAENAKQGHELSESVSSTAQAGSKVMLDVMDNMQEIARSSDQIANILSVIDGIAFQTNILALNAAVEAARAGEQGRGFAVVANEVRVLAQRSAQASKEIHELIASSRSRVENGSQLTTRASETMSEIAGQIININVLMREIASASKEQSLGIDQINIAVNQMEDVAQQNAALVEQSAMATRSLKEQTQQLVQAMASFKLA
ncbi:methyl-accepting chemotaxis protein [Erwinia toletana]|uniref:Methyl-accepting chemotaxis protein n=1 Tax=Winslowiella toletana TaxID=92490 RepID=A0ABS4P657_9GAMM|nr:methyl-accepting chemotaxis protein [Winslowiella toletana]MBP2168119.1 methyl-accepting chemotaxis protein [Winslowiella toletana]